MPRYNDRQEILNKVYNHFVIQKNPRCVRPTSRSRINACCYSGTGCAIGCLLDHKDRSEWDSLGIYFSSITFNTYTPYQILEKISEYFNLEDYDFLRSLQRVHDRGLEFSIEESFDDYKDNPPNSGHFYLSFDICMSYRLKQIAERFNLQFPGDA